MAPSALSSYLEPVNHEAKKIEVTTHIKQVSPSCLTDDDPELLHPERMPQALGRNGEVNGFHTPQTPESLESDDPVVIVGMGEQSSSLPRSSENFWTK